MSGSDGAATTRPELHVPGVPECALAGSLVSRLPANLAPAPWTARCQAVVWGMRPSPEARSALPPALRDSARVVAVLGGMVRYLQTPVGAYDEVFGIVLCLDGRRPKGTVAFMAVDSETSLVGGRTNWAMPKTLAAFEGDPMSGMTATGSQTAWRVSANPRAVGPAVPYRSDGVVRQEFPDGSVRDSAVTGRFRMRPAVVTIEVSSQGSLAAWLRPGRHLGAVSADTALEIRAPGG